MKPANALPSARKTIAIIGGGASGTLTACHLVNGGAQARVVILEPRAEKARGLAYSTPSLQHLLNVPAGKISALPHQPEHFTDWLRAHHDPAATAFTFAPRAVFGSYLQSLLAATPGVEQRQAEVVGYTRTRTGATLTLADGSELLADYVVLATGNFSPAELPGIAPEARAAGLYCQDAWSPETYRDLPPEAPVLLVGSGLTAVDVLLRLRELGHRGPVTAASRHGVLPNRHADASTLPTVAIPSTTAPRCLAYLRAVRAAIAGGAEWRAVIDSLRAVTNELWLALPLAEQKRFRRHLQRRWDVVRHRMAPPIADCIAAELAAGTLAMREGRLAGVQPAPGSGAQVTLQTAHGEERLTACRVINCTGPEMRYRRVESPLLRGLLAQGIAIEGPLGHGLHCSGSGAVIGADGNASPVLFAVGPGRLGTLLESIAIPEIREQAAELAATLVEAAAPAYDGPRMHRMEATAHG